MIWPWSRFQLPEPPADAAPVWRIGSPDSPLSFHLNGGGRVLIAGWFASLRRPVRMRGVALYVNGELRTANAQDVVPEHAPWISGAVGLDLGRKLLYEPHKDALHAKVRAELQAVLAAWAAEQAKDGELRSTRVDVPLPPSPGTVELDEMRLGQQHRPDGYLALGEATPAPVEDVQMFPRLRLFDSLSHSAEVGHKSQRAGIYDPLPADLIVPAPTHEPPDTQKLRRWFAEGFSRAGRHYRQVAVRIVSAADLEGRTALVALPARVVEDADRTAAPALVVNADSDLARSLSLLSAENVAVTFLPLIIHSYALLFSIGAFSRERETMLWGEIRELADCLAPFGRDLDSAELRACRRQVEELAREVEMLRAMLGQPI